jgi:glycosyl transferase family 25
MKSGNLLSEFPSCKRNIEMFGTFKNKDHFENHRYDLFNQFNFKIYPELDNSTYVYIDYTFLQSQTYFIDILDKLNGENKQVQVVIDSQNYDEIRNELQNRYMDNKNITIVDNISDYDKLCVMVSCKAGGYYTGTELGFWAAFFLLYAGNSIDIHSVQSVQSVQSIGSIQSIEEKIYTEPIIMICGCQKYKEHLILAIKRFENTSCKVIGLIGGVSQTEYDESTQILSLQVEDDYERLPSKIYEGMNWIHKNYPNCRGIFKTDDDIFYPNFKILIDIITKTNNLYMGCVTESCNSGNITLERMKDRFSDMSISGRHQSAVYCWGAGYWVHNSVLSYIVNAKEYYTKSYIEDICTGYVLNQVNIFPSKLNILFVELPRSELNTISNVWDLIDKIIYINLDKRVDRKNNMEKILSDIPNDKIIRFSAIQDKKGYIGCTKSHIECLRIAKENNWKNVLILEDDIIWDKQHFNKGYLKLIKLIKNPYDVILLGTAHAVVNMETSRLYEGQTACAYIVANHYYDQLISTFTDSLNGLLETDIYCVYAHDQYWKILQKKDNWYYSYPGLFIQGPDYSNIENTYVDYSEDFKNIKYV